LTILSLTKQALPSNKPKGRFRQIDNEQYDSLTNPPQSTSEFHININLM